MSNHTCCARQRVKRGLWSPEEDEKLVNYVTTHGHGCWSTVPRLAGLQRCGKSCRLRWINYLRPDLKRGNFTSQEAALIIELHRVIGNRWAQIARRLPGRTDNEVKNFWNANIKRKLLAHHSLIDPSTALGAFSLNHNQNMLLQNKTNNNNNNIPNNLIINPITINNNPTSQLIHQPHYNPPPPSSHLNMNYDSALMLPPSVNVSQSSSHLPPFPVSCSSNNNYQGNPDPIIMDQNYLQNGYQPFDQLVQDNDLMFGLDSIEDQDLDLLEALMPEIRSMAKGIACEFPVASAPVAAEGLQEVLVDPTAEVIGCEFTVDSSSAAAEEGQEVLDPTAVVAAGNSSFDSSRADSGSEPLHPTHIKNIASLMASFAPPGSFPPEPWDVPFPESPSFTASNWGPQP